jgi:hypothetical protein
MRITSILTILVLTLGASLWAETESPKKSAAVIRINNHPENIIEHYKWCLKVKSLKTQTIRLRDFWEDYNPKGGDYGDSIDERLVLIAGYKLVENYCRMKKTEEAISVLRWIRSEDHRLIKEERK